MTVYAKRAFDWIWHDFEVLCILQMRCQELQRGVNVFHTVAKLRFALCFVVFAASSVHYKSTQIAINAELPTNPASIKLFAKVGQKNFGRDGGSFGKSDHQKV